MELTNTVIEGGQVRGAGVGRWEGQVSGTVVISATVVLNVCPCCTADPLSVLVQFSLMDRTGAPRGAGSTKELVEMLKFGLGALLESTDSKDEDIDFEEILGRSERGEWVETGLEGRRGRTTLEGGGSRTEGVLAFDLFCAAAVCVCLVVCVHVRWVEVVVVCMHVCACLCVRVSVHVSVVWTLSTLLPLFLLFLAQTIFMCLKAKTTPRWRQRVTDGRLTSSWLRGWRSWSVV